MQVVIPNKLVVLYASVPEDEAPAWSATTAYVPGDVVIYAHYVYSCIIANTNVVPFGHADFEMAEWRTERPTNKWAAVDLYGHSKTRALEGETRLEIWVPFMRPATSVYLMDMDDATDYHITLEDTDGNVVYDSGQHRLLQDSASWWEYWLGPFVFKKDIGLNDLPPITGTLKIVLNGARPAIGRIIVGQRVVFGETEYGAQGGLIDYSINTTNPFGDEVWLRRRNARKSSFAALMPPNEVNYVQQTISRSLAGYPALYIGDNNTGYEPLIVFGFLREYDATYLNVSTARVTLDVRGIT